MPLSPTRIVAPWYGGMTITIAAPAACALRLRSAHRYELKCVVVTITGTRPATCSSTTCISVLRSSSERANCSEKFARMHRPFEPASIMKSMQRFWPSRSSRPASSKMVGATGNTPRSAAGWDAWVMVMSLSVSETRKFECLHRRLYGGAHRRYIELFPSCDRFYDSPPAHPPTQACANERHPERAAVEAAHEAAAIADRAR